MKHMPQIDGLRAIAVLAVLAHHFLPYYATLGSMGVQLFFVISGFLITGILLDTRDNVDTGRVGLKEAFVRFYYRRTLRIFPLFYLALVIGCLLALPGFLEYLPWHALYLSCAPVVHGNGHAASHFWSLSVEELYYLAWPAVVLLTPRRRLLLAIGLMIAFSVAYRAGINHAGFARTDCFLPWANFDYLGWGALLAYARRSNAAGGILTPHVVLACGWAMLAFSGKIGMRYQPDLFRLCEGLFFAGVVHHASLGIPGLLGRALDLPPVQYIGRISYGLYVWHLPVVYAVGIYVWPHFHTCNYWYFVPFKLAATFAIAIPSYHLFEKPINALKDKQFGASNGISQHLHNVA